MAVAFELSGVNNCGPRETEVSIEQEGTEGMELFFSIPSVSSGSSIL
jgi:hypothetical protein